MKKTDIEVNKKPKILYIVEAMGGGVFSYMVDLTNWLCNEFDVIIAFALRPQTPIDYREYFDSRIKLIEVKNFIRQISIKHDINAFFEIKKIFKLIQPDIVHLHSSKAGFIGRFAINGKKAKMFYTPHGYSFLKIDDPAVKRQCYKFFERLAAKRKCTTIACSKSEYETTLKFTGDATFINNGINIDEIKITCNNSQNNKDIKICTVGRICIQKNPVLFNKIAEAFPYISFTWIGDGEMRSALTAPNITVTGWGDRKSTLYHLRESEIFMLPSQWEGLSISLLEAMYLKKICITSNVTGNRDVIRHGENGFIANSLEEYINIIRNIKDCLFDLDIIRDNCYKDVLKEYNVRQMAFKYSNVYTDCLRVKKLNENK